MFIILYLSHKLSVSHAVSSTTRQWVHTSILVQNISW